MHFKEMIMKLLHIDSSILAGNSVSRQLTAQIVASWRAAHPDTEVNYLDLAVDTPSDMNVTGDWDPWLKVMGLPEVRTKNTLRFTQYADAIGAAVAGQGVAIGRFPLLNELLRDKRLVAPFKGLAASQRGYYVAHGARAASNPDAQDFIAWLRAEALLANTSPRPA